MDRKCGGPCAKVIPAGKPVMVVDVPTLSRKRLRCVKCAGETPPVDLPPLPAPTAPETFPFVRFGPGMLPLDFKQKASGEE